MPITFCNLVRLTMLIACSATVAAADPPIRAAARIDGAMNLTCTPDEKSAQAGATAFDDQLAFEGDHITSAALAADGFGEALAIPQIVNTVVTFKAAFKKKGATATYFGRMKEDGTVTGSLTRVEGGKTLRYTLSRRGAQRAPDVNDRPAQKEMRAGAEAAFDADVLRVNGGFVRLMTAQIAMTEARITDKTKKAAVAQILKDAGEEQIRLKATMLAGDLTSTEYVHQAGFRLLGARRAIAEALGQGDATTVEASYDKPVTAAFLHLNRLRAGLAEMGLASDVKRADKILYERIVELGVLVNKPAGRKKAVLATFRVASQEEVEAALNGMHRKKLTTIVEGLSAAAPPDDVK